MSECCFFDAEESINVHVFVMLKKEELKELGMSFGGRKVLEKLMEEIRLQAMKHKGRCVNCQHYFMESLHVNDAKIYNLQQL